MKIIFVEYVFYSMRYFLEREGEGERREIFRKREKERYVFYSIRYFREKERGERVCVCV